MMLPTDAKKRKDIPIYSGFWCYFPDAIAAVAELSRLGNDQHNPGKDLFWDRSKSGDELDALARHLTDHAKGVVLDADGVRHLTKNAWRAMAALQKALEEVVEPVQPLDYELNIETASEQVARQSGHAQNCPCHACAYWRRALCGQWE